MRAEPIEARGNDPSGARAEPAGSPDVARFLERFERFGATPSVETYLALFHPDARLFDEGMERPIGVSEIGAHIAGVLALVKGFRMRPERWRARGARVFMEAHNAGEIAGTPVSWRAVYRIELEGSLVRDGRRYFDRAPLLARIDPGVPSLAPWLAPRGGDAPALDGAVAGSEQSPRELVERCARAWRDGRPEALQDLFREDGSLLAPGLARPLGGSEIAGHYRRLSALLDGAGLSLRSWAGDDSLLFVEWQGAVPTPDGPYALGLVDRFDLVAGRVLAARSYFESAALARALGPASARV
jgi:limonene-1,2-epoxide hydrolase